MKLLAVSDEIVGFLYSPMVREQFSDVDLILSCGDLPYYYLEFLVSMLDVPCYFVRGNHSAKTEYGVAGSRKYPWGAVDLHRRFATGPSGLLLAGFEGSLRYNLGPHQYTQSEYWSFVFGLVPRLMVNKSRHGRYLDILITHAPPWKVHDEQDLPHQGVKAYRWLIKVFKPAYLLHGHVHVYRNDTVTRSLVDSTIVENVYRYKKIVITIPETRKPAGELP